MTPSDALKSKVGTKNLEMGEASLNLPNSLTLFRIFLIPVFVWLYMEPTPERAFWAGLVFSAAAFTDFLDGYLARRSGQITNLGKLLDPVADKLLVASGLILLVQAQQITVWLAIIMIARELIITGARAVAAKEGLIVPADSIGKFKVVGQIGGILCLIFQVAWLETQPVLSSIGIVLLYTALVLSLVSGWGYLVRIFKKLGPQYW